MTLLEFLRSQFIRLHRQLDRGLADLTDEQWHWIPDGRGNSIAFIAWHYVRTEDNIIRFILQDRRSTVWMEGNWAERLGLPSVSQGTGMREAEAQALRIASTPGFLDYMHEVWASTDLWLAGLTDLDVDRPVTIKPLGEMPVASALGQVGVGHGMGHAGEIQHLRALLALPGLGI